MPKKHTNLVFLLNQLYQRILIYSGNPFIYGLPHLGSFSVGISMINGTFGVPFCGHGIGELGPKKHTNLAFFQANCTNVS